MGNNTLFTYLSLMKTAIYFIFLLASITASSQNRYDVVIDEIMADPTPQIGLPAKEWME
jgi:hypothetical protein